MSLKLSKIPQSGNNISNFSSKKCLYFFSKNHLQILKFAHKQSLKNFAIFFKQISFVKVSVIVSLRNYKTKNLSLTLSRILTILLSLKKICSVCVKNYKIKINLNINNFSWFFLMPLDTTQLPLLLFVSCLNNMNLHIEFWILLDLSFKYHRMFFLDFVNLLVWSNHQDFYVISLNI